MGMVIFCGLRYVRDIVLVVVTQYEGFDSWTGFFYFFCSSSSKD